jgi:membrane-associated phospholipid phosphatase
VNFAATVTSLGDLFVAGLVALVVTVWIWRTIDSVTAFGFALCFCGGLGIATVLKLFTRDHFFDPAVSGPFDLSSGAPSGHAVLAGLLYGSALAAFLRVGRGGARVLGALVCIGAITAVAVTRVTLHTHTIADVLAGLGLAALGTALFASLLQWRRPQPKETWSLLALIVGVSILALASGVRMSSTELL